MRHRFLERLKVCERALRAQADPFLRSQVRELREAMPASWYRRLPMADGEPRVWWLAVQLVKRTQADFDADAIHEFFGRQEPLQLAELWAIEPLLKLALLEAAAEGNRHAAGSLRRLETASWRDLVETLSAVERILREDPVYGRMDFETRDHYRHAIEGLAKRRKCSEAEAARGIIDEARRSGRHVGHLLLASPSLLQRFPNCFYVGGIIAVTVLLLWVAWRLGLPGWLLLLAAAPASQTAVALMNRLTHLLVPPRRLPRMDFSEGIPDDCRTFVVVPTLLLSRGGVESLLQNLEIHYLANREPNLLFALLTDFPDSSRPGGTPEWLLGTCAEGIRTLNSRYGSAPFYLFHRRHQWNPSEGAWMGRERKRGKLEDFNRYLLGQDDAFQVKVGDLEAIGNIRYVLTLDSDTQLPRDTARQLIANMAHPLNRPDIDPESGIVVRGHGLLLPRVGISMESAGRSRLARIFSGQTGFDPYTTAVSDVYQDLYGRASYTGKGIYDLAAFQQVLDSRFPDNALLSHDLIEGEHLRAGLVTDQEFIDDYPASYEAWAKRKHRWARGDWQVTPWLGRTVPDAKGRRRNPLPLVSRWKILDNLRRSLIEPSLLLTVALAPSWATVAAAWLLLPGYVELLLSALRVPPRRYWRTWTRDLAFRLGQAHVDALFQMVFVAHQGLAMGDAVVRTLARRWWTHRKLLEWESMAQAEASAGRGLNLMVLYLYGSPVVAAAIALFASTVPLAVLQSWIFAPLVVFWVNGRPRVRHRDMARDVAFLRDAALSTWRFFAELPRREGHWLAPDNVQEDPPAVAWRTSPTNLGMQLNAIQCARDFGYLTTTEMTERTERVLLAMCRMQRHRGHFLNWYDTRTLEPLEPRFVSAVDSGNLAASLLVLKQGCRELLARPVLDATVMEGLRDHCMRLRGVLRRDGRGAAAMLQLASLLRQLEYRPSDFFFWESVLTETRELAVRLRQMLRPMEGDTHYWTDTLLRRIETALAELYGFAPWLGKGFEQEARFSSGLPELAALSRVPTVGELPEYYAGLAASIRDLCGMRQLRPSLCQTLEQLLPRLAEAQARGAALRARLEKQAAAASALVEDMDFAFLWNSRRKLLHIGCDAATGRLDPAHYDLLASEARTAVFLAIAKGDAPREAWFRLGRKLTAWRGQRTLLSWSGTMFEYLMPCLFMETWEQTLLGQSLRAAVRVQQSYAHERGVPWGISEAAFEARDAAGLHQYQAFGIPAVGLKRGLGEELVVAPYASMLALMVDPAAATANLRTIAAQNWTGAYGYYESADFSGGRPRLVRSFMAHHQGMTLGALCNVLCGGAMRKRFHADPLVQATEYLLQERVPVLPHMPEEEPEPAAMAPEIPAAEGAGS